MLYQFEAFCAIEGKETKKIKALYVCIFSIKFKV